VKYFLAAILLLHSSLFAQLGFPDGVANTYTLSERDGYNSFIYSAIGFAPDGTVYTCDYSGVVEIHGNNYSARIDSLKKWGVISNVKIAGPDEVWLMGIKYIAVLKNKQLSQILKAPEGTFTNVATLPGKRAYVFAEKNGQVETWVFDGTSLRLKAISPARFNAARIGLFENPDQTIWLFYKNSSATEIYKLDSLSGVFIHKKDYSGLQWIWKLADENNFYASYIASEPGRSCRVTNGQLIPMDGTFGDGKSNSYYFSGSDGAGGVYKFENGKYFTATIDNGFNIRKNIPFSINDNINMVRANSPGNLWFAFTGNRLTLVNPFIRKYPYIFDQSNAAVIFTLKEDSLGRIWAGSYQNNLSLVDKGVVRQIAGNPFKMTNGGTYYNGFMYLVGEGNGGLLQYDMKGKVRQLQTGTTGFYTWLSRDRKYFYFTTTSTLGLWQTNTRQLEKGRPEWNKINAGKGMLFNNLLTITEDTTGRIWCGHPKTGIGIYYPQTDKATSWLIAKNETAFGAISSLTDSYGTVWLGSDNGLWFYNDYTKKASPASCQRVNHPLLSYNKTITALTVAGNWLVIAAYDKILLLNLPVFHKQHRISLRYLTPYETAFTSFTEQNTLLAAKDSTVWFSTSDMLYQWDFNRWLQQPVYKATISLLMTSHKREQLLQEGTTISLPPGFSSFDLSLRYISPDNMPRYLRAGLLKEGTSDSLPAPSLQSEYSFKNLGSGRYRFMVEIFETDGSTSRYVYSLYIRKFIWQEWWFWALSSAVVAGIIFFFADLRRKRQLAEQNVRIKEAELLSFKNEQEKKLASLQLVTLSNQFRPHFILNALNTIGAKMDNHPELETVLSRLGESVTIIFNHAQQQKMLHPFADEWKLVTNVIHIHRLMYLKQLETVLPDEAILQSLATIPIPLGLLQIPVENALLHGLSNRETGPWQLTIEVHSDSTQVLLSITDNGVGRKKSATLSNFTRHGTGIRTMDEVIQIINTINTSKITIEYRDDVFHHGTESFGTTVIITLPKNIRHDFE